MKKIVFTTLVALIVSITSNAQLLGSLKLDPKNIATQLTPDTLIKSALRGSVVVVRQSYQVKNKKNEKVFGRNGRKDFGHNYSISVKTENGLTLTTGALKPWMYDNAFKKVENEYEPIISLTEVRDVETTGKPVFSQCPLRINLQKEEEGLWMANVADMQPNAMEIDTDEGDKDGWIIWYIAKQNLDDQESANIALQINAKKLNVQIGGRYDIDVPSDGDLVLGGIYVCPQYKGGGHVSFRLVGIMTLDEGSWKLSTPFAGLFIDQHASEVKQEEQIEAPQAELIEEDVELTPVGDEKKKKNKKSKK